MTVAPQRNVEAGSSRSRTGLLVAAAAATHAMDWNSITEKVTAKRGVVIRGRDHRQCKKRLGPRRRFIRSFRWVADIAAGALETELSVHTDARTCCNDLTPGTRESAEADATPSSSSQSHTTNPE
jgi:hypothetical protein